MIRPIAAPSRHAETPLQMPSARQVVRAVARTLRLRCPNCGSGPVLTRFGAVRPRCAGCGLRFERTDDSYFSGAVFFGLVLGEAVFALSLLVVLLSTWPDVPWNVLQYAPVGMALIAPLLLPVSRVLWLAIDVLVRPVVPEELAQRRRD